MHLELDPDSPGAETIHFDDFLKVDIRVGTVLDIAEFPEARKPSYKLKIDFGKGVGVKKSSAQITVNYNKDQILGKQVIAVVNFPPRQIGPFMSEVLVLGVMDEQNQVVLLESSKKVPNGARLV